MQFQYNADFPKDDDFPGGTTGTSGTGNNNNCKIARDPWTFPAAHPVPCTRITTRVYHPLRQTVTTVQNVLVRSHTTNTNSNNTNGNGNSTNNSNIRKSRQSCRPKTTTLTGEEEEVPVNLDTDVTMKDDTDDNSSNSSSSNSDFSSSDEDAAHPPHSSNNNNEDDDNECAYWIQRTVREAIYGRVLFAIVLKKRRVPLSFLQQQQQNSATVPSSTDTPSATAPFSSSSPPTLSLPSLYLDNAPAATIPNAAQVETMSSNSTAATAAMIAIWEVTPFHCAVKEMSWQHIRKERHRLAENPIQEISAMQYLQSYYYSRSQQPDTTTTNNDNSTNNNGNTTQNLSTNPSLLITTTATTSATKNETVDDSTFRNNETKNNNSSSSFVQTAFSTMTATNLMMPLDILSDDGHLYSVMPYCNGGELFEWLDQHEKFPEAQARYWMHQILNVREVLCSNLLRMTTVLWMKGFCINGCLHWCH